MTDLDHLVARARTAPVRRATAEAYVRELERWARPASPSRAWLPWLAGGLALAAVAVLAIVATRGPAPRPLAAAPVQVGDRVAIVAEPGTSYRVVAATESETRIAIEHGTITARLWHGARAHQLSLEGGGVIATATGTVYSLAVGPDGPVVHVDEGTVAVVDRTGTRAVPAGASFPASGAIGIPRAASVLLALAAPDTSTPVARDAAVDAPGAEVVRDASPHGPPAPRDASPGPAATPTPASMTVKDRWHHARLLRGQGRFADAVAECVAIADAHDATWSPIALVEAIRIYLGPLAQPERAIDEADRLHRDWPTDALAGEAQQLRCQALGQLGRGAECAPP